jgi:hypothetical protein
MVTQKAPEILRQDAIARFLLEVSSVLTAAVDGDADFPEIEAHVDESMTKLRAALLEGSDDEEETEEEAEDAAADSIDDVPDLDDAE